MSAAACPTCRDAAMRAEGARQALAPVRALAEEWDRARILNPSFGVATARATAQLRARAEGSECHTPGCVLHDVPDHPLNRALATDPDRYRLAWQSAAAGRAQARAATREALLMARKWRERAAAGGGEGKVSEDYRTAAGMAVEQRRILALLDDPDVLEAMAHAHYRSQWPAVDDWDEGTDLWRALHCDDMRTALDVLRARIEEDRDA
jgi:hypothetical protein